MGKKRAFFAHFLFIFVEFMVFLKTEVYLSRPVRAAIKTKLNLLPWISDKYRIWLR